MTGQETDFHEVGLSSVNGLEVDYEEQYFVLDVTFGDGNDGEMYYPYRVVMRDDEPKIETGPHRGYVRVPVSGESGQDGFREKSIGVTSDVPRWVKDEIKELFTSDSDRCDEFAETHNMREVKFYF